ncbi:MAG: methyltransferase domain-containing protein [Phycisphaerae bacterium]|nr:methyltransferase domain-containing protein [Phycisphaerae bacterium]
MMMDNAHSLFDFGPLAAEYDRWYDTSAGRSHDQYQKNLVRSLLPAAKPGERLLDVGCGTGHWSRFFASLGYAVVGVDTSGQMIDVAKANDSPQCDFEIADACNLPFDADSFEVVAAMATMEFVSDAHGALTEMFRCVKPMGRVLIGTLNRLAPINQNRLARDKEPYASAHLFSPEDIKKLLGQYGRVRMGVSPEAATHKLPGNTRSVPPQAAELEQPGDAFIVAEVRP